MERSKKKLNLKVILSFFFLTAILAPTHLLHGSYSSVLMRLHHHSIDLLIFLKKDTYIYATRTHAYPHTNMSAHILQKRRGCHQNPTYGLDNLGVKVKNMNFNTRGTCLQVKLMMMKLYELYFYLAIKSLSSNEIYVLQYQNTFSYFGRWHLLDIKPKYF